MRDALHLLAALLFSAALVLARCALVLGPLRPTLRRWTIAVATLATRARCAARRSPR